MSIALIDSNNFYAACEQSIDPSLIGRPLVILSNNDGCIIARNAEAKSLGISMGEAYFKIRKKLTTLSVEVRSSNYSLYADMSQRLMSLLRDNCEEVEVYSIDEAFIKIPSRFFNINAWAHELRESTYQKLGLPIAIGIGATKSQSKLANYLAKKIACHAGIFNIEATTNQDLWLEQIEIEKIWGIGQKLAYWCHKQGIHNARQFRDAPSNILKEKLGIIGVRLQKEIQGEQCLKLSKQLAPKQETCVSRSFSPPITQINELRQAIANHVISASEKLRKQKQNATKVTIFTRTSLYSPNFYSQSATQYLDIPSNDTQILLTETLSLTKKIFKPNHLLIKAGVIMQGLISEDFLQLHLFSKRQPYKLLKQEYLMKTIDYLNKRYGRNTITWAASGINQSHNSRQGHLSTSSTTNITEIPIVIA